MPVPQGTYNYGSGGGGGGGLFGSMLHILGKTGTDLESAAINAIPGFYHMGGQAIHDPFGLVADIAHQTATDLRHPLRHPGYTLLDLLSFVPIAGIPARAGRIAAISARAGALPESIATKELAVAAGRTAEYNRIVNPITGAKRSVASQVADEVFKGIPEQARILRMPVPHLPGEDALATQEGLVAHGWWYSQDPIIRKAQKLVDQAYEKKFSDGVPPPIWRVLPPFWRTQAGRIQSAGKAENLINRMTSRSKAGAFLAEHGARSDPEHMAVRMVGEMTTPETRLAYHQRLLDSGSLPPKFVKETERTMATIQEASKYLENKTIKLNDGSTHVVPVIKPEYPELQDYVNKAREISNDRSTASRIAGVLTSESHYRRINAVRNLMLTGKIPENLGSLAKERKRYVNLKQPKRVAEIDKKISEELGQLTLEGLGGPEGELIKGATAEELALAAEGFRIPYKPERPPKLSFGQDAYRRAYTGRKPRTPGTYTHQFQGAILQYGGGEANVAKLLAESYTEAHRFISLMHARNFILSHAQDTPKGIPEEYRQLVRTDEYFTGKQAPTYEKAGEFAQRTPEQTLMEKESLTPEDTIAGGKLYEGMRQRIFPKIEELTLDVYRALTGKDGQTYQPVAGYKWIDKRLLGGLDKKNPLVGAFENGVVRRAVHTADMVNNIQKAMILYLKPSYALPNMLGNIGLTLVQQGFLMPYNLAKTFRLTRTLDKQTVAQIRGAVGQGIAESGLTAGGGAHALVWRTGNKFASGYGRVIDDPFRFSSFVHEAGQSGFSTKAEIRALVNDPKHADEFRAVANRANDALINYERLGPGEQAFLRRLVFFYPWVKGSSRYVSTFWKEHPLAAGAQGTAGQMGEERISKYLGEVPSFAEGMIPYDVSNPELPIVGGTQSTSILSEPAELAKIVTNIFKSNPNQDLPASMNLAPADAGLLALITSGVATTLGHPGSQPVYRTALNETFGGNPMLGLWRTMHGQSAAGGPISESLYPDFQKRDALLRFFVTGALTPRPYNKELGELKAYKQKHPGYVS